MFPRIDKGPIEYSVLISKEFNREQQRDCVRFTFETVEEFSHFKYSIAVEEEHGEDTLVFRLKGLKTTGMTLPGVGKAIAEIDVFDLQGEYGVRISKPGDLTNAFRIKVSRKTPRLLTDVADDKPFLIVGTS